MKTHQIEEKDWRFRISYAGKVFTLDVDSYQELLEDLSKIFPGVPAEEFRIGWTDGWVNLATWCQQRELTYPIKLAT